MIDVKYIVIGAGITGLRLCSKLKNHDYLLLEKENEVGGYCRTIYQDDFTWDYSGHFFHFRYPEIKDFFLKNIYSEVRIIKKVSKIFYNNTYIDFPFQENIHQLDKNEFIDCLYDLYFCNKSEQNTFYGFLINNYGESISRKFLIPYNEKLYATNLNNLDKDAMGRFFPHSSFDRILRNFKLKVDNSYNNTFLYPKKGAIEFINAICKYVERSNIRINEEVIHVDYKNKVVETNNDFYKYDILVNTMPFNRFLNVLHKQCDQNIYSSNKVLVFNIGFDKKGPTNIHWIYFPDTDIIFYRVGFYDNIHNSDRMSIYVEIGLKSNDDIDINSCYERVLMDLRRVKIVENHNVVCYSSLILDPAYVHITKDSIKDFKDKERVLNQHDIYSIGRYGRWTYCSIEDNIIDSDNLIKTFVNE